VLNKWDVSALVEEDLEHERAVVTTSFACDPGADRERQDGPNVGRVLQEAVTLGDRMRTRIPDAGAERFLAETVEARQPPAKQGDTLADAVHGQFEVRPPRFAIQVTRAPGDA